MTCSPRSSVAWVSATSWREEYLLAARLFELGAHVDELDHRQRAAHDAGQHLDAGVAAALRSWPSSRAMATPILAPPLPR